MGAPAAATPYLGTVAQAAADTGVPAQYLAGIIDRESGWNPLAINNNKNGTTDYGIAQLNNAYYPNAMTLTATDQIYAAASALKSNFDQLGNWASAIGAYNTGVKGSKDNPLTAASYAADVMRRANNYSDIASTISDGAGGLVPKSTGLQGLVDTVKSSAMAIAVGFVALGIIWVSVNGAVKSGS